MRFIKTILWLYVSSIFLMSMKGVDKRISNKLGFAERDAARKLNLVWEVDYQRVCDGCDFVYKYGRLEYWKSGKLYWSDITWGSGSGSISKTSMGAAPATSSGDRLVIVAGTYANITASALTNVAITIQSTRVNYTGTLTLGGNTQVTVSFLTCIGSSTGVQYTGQNNTGGLNHISFSGVTGDCINSDVTRTTYAGTTATLSLYLMTFDSITADQSGYLHRLNFGSPSSGQGFSDSLVYTRIKITQTLTNGEEIRGICERIKFDQASVSYVGTPPSAGDVGILTIYGNGQVSNVTQNNCKGYIGRFYCSQFIGTGAYFYFFNNLKTNGVSFGCVSPRVDPADFGTYIEGIANVYIWNSAIINSHDAAYISPFMVLGAHLLCTIHIHNNYSINVTTAGGSAILQNDAGTGALLDTSNNSTYASNTLFVSATTYVPLAVSYMRNGGTTKSWMSNDGGNDKNGNPWESPRPIGPLTYFTTGTYPGVISNKRKAF